MTFPLAGDHVVFYALQQEPGVLPTRPDTNGPVLWLIEAALESDFDAAKGPYDDWREIGAADLPMPEPDYDLTSASMAENATLQARSEWGYSRTDDGSTRLVTAETHGGGRHLVGTSTGMETRAQLLDPTSTDTRVRVHVAGHTAPSSGSSAIAIRIREGTPVSGANAPHIRFRLRRDSSEDTWAISGDGQTPVNGVIGSYPAAPFIFQAEVIGATIRMSYIKDGVTTTLGEASFGNSFSGTRAGLDILYNEPGKTTAMVSQYQMWTGITDFNAPAL